MEAQAIAYYLSIGFRSVEAERLARLEAGTYYLRGDEAQKDLDEERRNGWSVR